MSAEALAESGAAFDAVVASEVKGRRRGQWDANPQPLGRVTSALLLKLLWWPLRCLIGWLAGTLRVLDRLASGGAEGGSAAGGGQGAAGPRALSCACPPTGHRSSSTCLSHMLSSACWRACWRRWGGAGRSARLEHVQQRPPACLPHNPVLAPPSSQGDAAAGAARASHGA